MAEFTGIHQISGNSSKFSEIGGNLRNFRLSAKKRDSGGNDQKCLPFRFIIATFWSVGGKRGPLALDLRNSRYFAKITEICEISGILVTFSEF
jgi:hypothetical protein